jgi:hypothetical protein
MTEDRIERGELEANLRALQREIVGEARERKPSILRIGGGLILTIVVVSYLLGRRAGRRRAGYIEIRR